jgi:hypothetical protein
MMRWRAQFAWPHEKEMRSASEEELDAARRDLVGRCRLKGLKTRVERAWNPC